LTKKYFDYLTNKVMQKRLIFICLSTIIGLCSVGQAKQQTKPNIVLFVVDDMGWKDLTCYGSDLHQTPNIDRLANEGIRFTDAYAACTVCSPTRAAIMTGKYPARLHITDWISGHQKPYAQMKIPDWTKFLPHAEITLAEVLKNNGYSTAHIGKWHLGETENYWPLEHGFDVNVGGWKAGSPRANGGGGYFSPYNNPTLPDGPKGEYLTERLASEAENFVRKQHGENKPFFLNFWLYNVHLPLQAKKEKIEKYKDLATTTKLHNNAVYAAQVEHADDAVGRILNTLKDLQLESNTIIIFTSDNGGIIGNYENQAKKVTSNAPLRSGKGDMYEGGVRVPFIVWWPGKIKPSKSETPVISTDIFPTLVSLVNLPLPENAAPDGKNLTPLLLHNEAIQRNALFWHYPHYHLEGAKPYSSMRQGNWKLVEVFETGLELYNLEKDIEEQHNLVKENPKMVSNMHTALQQWRKQVGAQLPVSNPLYDPSRLNEWNISPSATPNK
jgi:arylsulfatase A-like enzyme